MGEYIYFQERIQLYQNKIFASGPEASKESVHEEQLPSEISRAVECILKHFLKKELNTSYLMEVCHTRDNNFASRFKFYIGKSPKEFIQFHRLKIAALLLEDENLKNVSIVTIAMKLGFSGNGSFHHAFKREYGLSPGKWRKKIFE